MKWACKGVRREGDEVGGQQGDTRGDASDGLVSLSGDITGIYYVNIDCILTSG